jgi:hypothetical protein
MAASAACSRAALAAAIFCASFDNGLPTAGLVGPPCAPVVAGEPEAG